MAKETLGYVKLEWVCPNCGTRNPGPQKTCRNCGFAQPDNVEFQQAAQDTVVTDATEVEKAKKGPDVHCYYCGTRNPADAKVCSQCGADLTQATARQSGKVVGAHKPEAAKDVPCPSCGKMIPANADKCPACGSAVTQLKPVAPTVQPAKPMSPAVIVAIVGGVLLLLLVCWFLFFRTSDLIGTVESATWTRAIFIEQLGPVEHSNWRDSIPAGAQLGSCQQKVRTTQDEPVANANKVCGTPYTVDKGSGYGEVVQDCQYEISDDWCSYTVDEWRKVDELTASGTDYNPVWPSVAKLGINRREGARSEKYQITFKADGKKFTYDTTSFDQFKECEFGSEWILKVNGVGAVVEISPQ